MGRLGRKKTLRGGEGGEQPPRRAPPPTSARGKWIKQAKEAGKYSEYTPILVAQAYDAVMQGDPATPSPEDEAAIENEIHRRAQLEGNIAKLDEKVAAKSAAYEAIKNENIGTRATDAEAVAADEGKVAELKANTAEDAKDPFAFSRRNLGKSGIPTDEEFGDAVVFTFRDDYVNKPIINQQLVRAAIHNLMFIREGATQEQVNSIMNAKVSLPLSVKDSPYADVYAKEMKHMLLGVRDKETGMAKMPEGERDNVKKRFYLMAMRTLPKAPPTSAAGRRRHTRSRRAPRRSTRGRRR
jgi:hypothetical protein